MRVVPNEPWRGGQVCGEQIHYGTVALPLGTWQSYCGEPKADGVPLCAVHRDEQIAEYGHIPKFAPGNAVGEAGEAVRLMWEGENGGAVTPEPEDTAAWEAGRYTIPDEEGVGP